MNLTVQVGHKFKITGIFRISQHIKLRQQCAKVTKFVVSSILLETEWNCVIHCGLTTGAIFIICRLQIHIIKYHYIQRM
jgi:hypothetical protein